MIAHYMATYYSQWAHKNLAPRSQDQWYSFKFCRAVKSGRINGSMTFPWQAGPEVINEQNVARARFIFGLFVKYTVEELKIENPVLLPVPSKCGLVGAQTYRSLQMTQESMGHHGAWTISSALRFTEPLQPAHAGGDRGRDYLKPYLTLVEDIPAGPVILIDDLITTGGSLLASYDVLASSGRVPHTAIVAGHTVSDALLSAFGWHQKNIDTQPQAIPF